MKMPLARLWSRDFVAACLANFFLFFSFFILLPVLPIYINDVLKADQTLPGFVLATYTLAALSIRPFTGRFVDTMPRRAVFCYLLGTTQPQSISAIAKACPTVNRTTTPLRLLVHVKAAETKSYTSNTTSSSPS